MDANSLLTAVLALLTAVYVYLTKKLLDTTVLANQRNFELLSKQLLVQSSPTLNVELIPTDGAVRIEITNLGPGSALELEVHVVHVYDTSSHSIPSFLSRFVKPESHKKYEGFVPYGETYVVSDYTFYNLLAPATKAKFESPQPLPANLVEVVIQHLDKAGHVHRQVFSFFLLRKGTEPYYRRALIFRAEGGAAITRISMGEAHDPENVPDELQEYFLWFPKHAIDRFDLINAPEGIEERGTITTAREI